MRSVSLTDANSLSGSVAATSLNSREFRDLYAPRLYWLTWVITQRVGGYLAPRFLRMGIHPNAISLLSAAVGVVTSVAVAVEAHYSVVVAGVVAFLGWQLAYTLDYTDGQMARAAKLASPRGAVLDLMCDHLVQAATVIAAVHVAFIDTSGPFVGTLSVIFGLSWLIPFVHGISMAGKLESPISETVTRWGLGRVLRHLRDYMVQISILAVAIGFGSRAVFGVLSVVTIVNLAFMGYSIMRVAFVGDRTR